MFVQIAGEEVPDAAFIRAHSKSGLIIDHGPASHTASLSWASPVDDPFSFNEGDLARHARHTSKTPSTVPDRGMGSFVPLCPVLPCDSRSIWRPANKVFLQFSIIPQIAKLWGSYFKQQ